MTELLQVSCRSHHHIGVSTFKIAGYQHSTFHLPRSTKHYKMCGRAEHPVVEIHICERNHIVAKAWRNSGHNNKNNRDFSCSQLAAMFFAKPCKATFSFVGNPRAPTVGTWARESVNWRLPRLRHENFAGVYLFADWRFFCVLRQLIFTIRPILLFLLEIIFL